MVNRDKPFTFLREKTLLHLALIVLLGLLAYSNTFDVPFQFDDQVVLKSQRFMDIANVPSMFVESTGLWASRPLLHATMAVNYHLGGLDTTGYHAANLALHLVNGLLLYFLVSMTGMRVSKGEDRVRQIAFLSSAVFVLHPLQTEAVTYIVSRSMLMSTCFYFAGLILFLKAATSERRRGIYTGGLFLVSLLGMASRENFATFPVVLFLYDLFFVSRFRLRGIVNHYKAHLVVLISLGYMVYLVLTNTYAVSGYYPGEEGISPLEYVLTQLRVHWTYIRLLVLPINQSIDYDFPLSKTLFEVPTLLSFLGYFGLLVGSILFARRRPVMSFGMLWFLITLLPISFLVAFLDLRLQDVLFEHRAYLPNVGIIVASVTAGALLIEKLSNRTIMKTAIVCAAVLSVLLGSATYTRNAVWKSKMSIWEDVVRKSPGKWRGHYNLGNEYREEGLLEEAIEHYQEAIRLDPDYPKLYNNLGISYRALGLIDKALEQYLLALRRDPNLVETYNNIANIYLIKKLYDEAIDNYKIAITLKPDSAEAHYNMGNAYYFKGQHDKAVEHYRASLDLNPNEAETHNNLGMAYLELGQKELALREVETALRLDPELKEARESLEEILEAYGTVPGEVK
jgi:tetratricopeptide (TPR) repeat protein